MKQGMNKALRPHIFLLFLIPWNVRPPVSSLNLYATPFNGYKSQHYIVVFFPDSCYCFFFFNCNHTFNRKYSILNIGKFHIEGQKIIFQLDNMLSYGG